MQMQFQLGDTELDRGNCELLTEHLKSKFISSSLYKVNEKKSKFCYEFPGAFFFLFPNLYQFILCKAAAM